MGKTVPERVAAVVAEHTRTVFGLMGNGNAWFIHALAERGVEIIPVRHEAATVAAADAFHRTTRHLAVATTTYGPGFSNAVTPLIDAALNRSPLLLVAGANAAVDHAALAGATGARVIVAGGDPAADTRRALDVALAESVPVVLFLPSGAQAGEPSPGTGDAAQVPRLLSDARRPLILAGRGAAGARREVVALAETLGSDVAVTVPAKGFFRGARCVRDVGICGGFALPEAAVEKHRAPLRTGHPPGEELAPDGRLDPRSLFVRLNDILPRERVVVTDGGHFLAWPCMYLDVPGPDHLVLVGTAFESIGLGFGSAVGVVEAAGDRLTVLVTGDGGGLMALSDAESVLRRVNATGGRCVIVVVNDAAYGAEIHQYGTKGVAEAPMLIPEVDFAALLGVFGAPGTVVRALADLGPMHDWLATGESGTWVLDCRVSRAVVAPFLSGK